MRTIRHILCIASILALCGCTLRDREEALTPAEYYDLGRYARLDEDWEGAIGYFEKALSAAERAGNDYYRGYACQQLSALWAMSCEYSTALDYARSSVVALEACGESAGAALSRLEMAWHYLSMGDYASAQALLPPLRAAFSSPDSPDSPAAPRLAQLESALLDASDSFPAGSADVAGSGTPSSGAAYHYDKTLTKKD